MRKYKILYKPILVFVLICVFFVCTMVSVSASEVVITNETSEGIKGSINNGNDTITLTEGTYSGTNNTNITINNGKNITIQSQNPNNKSIIDCNGDWFIVNDGNLTLINLIIKNAYKTGNGAVIHNSGNLTIINCTFINNTANFGGVIYSNGTSHLFVTGSYFIDNYCSGEGGAISFRSSEDIVIVNSKFMNNIAESSGGAIMPGWSYSLSNIVENCSFINNTAVEYTGGAICNAYGYLAIVNCDFTNNTAGNYDHHLYGGGAISNVWANMSIIYSNFTNNNGNHYAGAIHNYASNVIVEYSNFINNTANKSGGAIYNYLNYNIIISNSKFINNFAGEFGGAIYNDISYMLLYNNSMSNNIANIMGNVIYNNGAMGILNLTFMSNKTNYPNSKDVVVFATLTDDMGNPVSGQNISFYIDGAFVANVTAVEGLANFTYTFVPEGKYLISGTYAGNENYTINILDGIISYKSNISSNLTLNKDKIKVNEPVTGKVTVTNSGNIKESDLKVVVKLPKNFVLDSTPTGAAYDPDLNTLTWILDTIDSDNLVVFEFTGYFTKFGNYTFSSDVSNNNVSINDSVDIEVIKNDTPTPGPTPVPKPIPINKTTDNPAANAAVMKKTGIPAIAIILVLLSSLGLAIRKR